MAQGMQNPISNYGNFGQVMANQWNAAQERALRTDLAQQQIDLQERQLDMQEEAYGYMLKNRQQLDEIAKQKYDLGREKRELEKDYKQAQEDRVENRGFLNYIDFIGWGDDSYWFPEEETFEDWAEKTGQTIPSEFDLQLPEDPTFQALQYFSQKDKNLESSLVDPASGLMDIVQR
tara:strand:+ start:6698 stop:7225 length:528 start_codon:yes stop_codon:yes gene_type:complete